MSKNVYMTGENVKYKNNLVSLLVIPNFYKIISIDNNSLKQEDLLLKKEYLC